MNLSFFLAQRIQRKTVGAFSATIHRIAVWSAAISLATLLIAFGVLYGFQEAIKDKVFHLAGHLTVNKYSFSGSFEDTFITINEELETQLQAHPEIAFIQPYAFKAGLMQSDNTLQGVLLKGVSPAFDTAAFRTQIKTGRFVSFEAENYSREVMLSRKISDQLEVGVDDEVVLYFLQQPTRYRKLRVVGIYETGLEEFDTNIVFGDLRLVQRMNRWDSSQVGGLEIRLSDDADIEAVEVRLFDELGFDLNAISAYRQYPQIFDWLELLSRNVLLILVIILVLGVFGMISMVLILIMERTQMIGSLKAMGAPNRTIRQMFVVSGFWLILKGLLIGNFVGLGVCALQYYFKIMPLDPVNYYIDFVPISFGWWTILGMNLLMALVIGLALFVPVVVISRIRPIRAIRFD